VLLLLSLAPLRGEPRRRDRARPQGQSAAAGTERGRRDRARPRGMAARPAALRRAAEALRHVGVHAEQPVLRRVWSSSDRWLTALNRSKLH
jgi:hypothetical protein